MSGELQWQPVGRLARPQIDYARELNEQQLAAVTAPPGPSLVIAGAGSGKTRTLTYRVAYLLEQGVRPERILLMTFTNKAAREMMRRVGDLLGQELGSLWGGTFHSIGNRVLRRHADLLGYGRDFSILDRDDAKHLLAGCILDSGIDRQASRFPKPDVLAELFSLAANTRRTLGQMLEHDYDHLSPVADEIATVHGLYAERKRHANAMDYDDLLALWLKLLQESAEAREHYQTRFQFILVDEYQDTNRLQGELVDLLAARYRNLMVVGDDAQSIYSWRGANLDNILKFPERYPEAKGFTIETNYRSTPEILNAANAAIAANVQQFPKRLFASREAGPKPSVVVCADGSGQAAFVAQQVLELREDGVALDRVAVLYRSHFHALELQFELTRRNIPFTITSGLRFYEQAHIRDLTAYLKLVANARDEAAFARLAQMVPGIGRVGAARLWKAFSGNVAKGPAPTAAVVSPVPDPVAPQDRRLTAGAAPPDPKPSAAAAASRPVSYALQRCAPDVPKKAAVAWTQLTATLWQLEDAQLRPDPGAMLGLAMEAGYEDYLKETYDNYRSRLEDLAQLRSYARQFSTLEEFLSQLALLSNVEAEEDQPAAGDEERVLLSTIHQAKGLEFDAVFIIMLCEGAFPSQQSIDGHGDIEEERRLFYVAITRARDHLYLSYPLLRSRRAAGGDEFQRPSRFLREIPPDLVDPQEISPFLA